ncbi:MAG: type VI secretion system baseplate subunit TssF [Myxococcota bacterium]
MATRDELLYYYERELDFVRNLSADFAQRYPEVAGRLELDAARSGDPHVERLIEAFALLTARIRMRLDDDFGEISDALLGILYPHFLAPIPSLSIAQFHADPDAAKVKGGLQVECGSLLFSKASGGVRCRFRSAYPVTLWPIEVESTEIVTATALGVAVPPDARAALRIRLRTLGGATFGELGLDRVRFFIDLAGGPGHRIHELLLRDPVGLAVQIRPGSPARLHGAEAIRPVGYALDEGLLAYPQESFLGYRLIQEYFAFPDKFLFVDLVGLDGVAGDDGETLDVSVLLREPVSDIDARVRPENLKLGCTPIANLFEMGIDPIQVTETAVEYPVVPDVRSPRSFEVHSIRSASLSERGSSRMRPCAPIFTLRHGSGDQDGVFWHGSRRAAIRKDDSGTDLFVSLVDERVRRLEKPPGDVLHIDALCTNRNLPSLLTFGDPKGDFDVQGRPGVKRVIALRKPSDPLRAPLSGASRWRLVSHLALNHLSLAGTGAQPASEERALEALREILKLYDFVDQQSTRQRIAGLVGLRTKPIVRRVGTGINAGFARGTEVELVLDPDQFTGTGAYLLASVLEVFLGLYTAANSFTQTVARTRQGQGVLKRWPPRAGEMPLL